MSQHGKFSTNSLKGGGFTRKTRFYLKDGSNLFRVLPPFGTLAEKGIIAKYYGVFWVEGTDGKKRPVPSILETKSNGKNQPKTILVRDPLLEKIEALKNSLAAMKQSGADPAVTEALERKLYGLYLDKAYYLNVISPSGEIGVLKLRYTAFQNLKTRLEELDKDGIDPINSGKGNGVVFDFKKIKDEKGKTVYPVDIAMKTYKDQATGKFISEIQQLEIDENTLKRMENEASDLNSLFRVLAPEEVALIATLDPKNVDRVFARPTAAEEAAADDGDDQDDTADYAVGAAKTSGTATALNAGAATMRLEAPAAPVTPPAAQQGAAAQNPGVQSIVDRFLATGKV